MSTKIRSAVLIVGLISLPIISGCTLTSLKRANLESDLSKNEPFDALAFQIDEKFGVGLSPTERINLVEAEKNALNFGEQGSPILWKGDDENVAGSVTVFSLFRVGKSNCRRFNHKITLGAKVRDASGTACQRGGGEWKLVV